MAISITTLLITTLSITMLNINTLSVVMLSVIMLSVMAPNFKSSSMAENISTNWFSKLCRFYFKSFLPASSRNGGASATVNFKNDLCCKILGQ
jgi:hypothetical protein